MPVTVKTQGTKTQDEPKQTQDDLQKENERLLKENEELKKQLEEKNKPSEPSKPVGPAQDAVSNAKMQAMKDERDRILAIDAIAIPGFEKIVEEAKKSGKSAAETSMEILKAQKDRGISMEAIRKDSPNVPSSSGVSSEKEEDESTINAIAAGANKARMAKNGGKK